MVLDDKILSVVIVSYRSRAFISICLDSLVKATRSIESQIIVIDNASHDGINQIIENHFPHVKLIVNIENVGFGKAANQGMLLAKGEYVAIINPDTILPEDLFETLISTYPQLERPGLIAPVLLDGKGKVLHESARNLPTFSNSIRKLLFSHSTKSESSYYASIDDDLIQRVDVLAGAFLFTTSKQLKSLGGFDEDYFMYGEDIDISHRFLKNGYHNYLIKESPIIHLKGESTNSVSWKSKFSFYDAMLIYISKWFTLHNLTYILLKFVTRILFVLDLFSSLIKKIISPIIDFLLSLFIFNVVARIWANFYYIDLDYFDYSLVFGVSILLSLGIVFSLFISSTYLSKKINFSEWIFKLMTTLVIGYSVYGLLPEGMRYSRMAVGFSFVVTILASYIWRHILWGITESFVYVSKRSNSSLKVLLNSTLSRHVDSLNNLLIHNTDTERILIDLESFSYKEIIEYLRQCHVKVGLYNPRFQQFLKFSGPALKSRFEDAGFVYRYSQEDAQFYKRNLDIVVGLLLLPFSAVCLPFNTFFIKNIYNLLIGDKTLVGLSEIHNSELSIYNTKIPFISVSEIYNGDFKDYARSYTVWKDLGLISKNIILFFKCLFADFN